MFFPIFFFFFLIHFVTSNSSNQEDLTISNYSHIGCLMLNPDKQLISNGLQENYLLPYQTFSSPNLTIDLCFRLCRQWTILMNTNHTNCICLYTIIELYEMNEHLGEVLSINNCTPNALEIYSLTKDPYLLPLPSPSPTDDWSVEGCYRIDVVQEKHANTSLNDKNYTLALDSCRKHCQINRNSTFFSFFLSFRKFCYCLPITLSPLGHKPKKQKTLSPSINTTGIRKPLVHCSFLPYIKKGFDNSFNESTMHIDTVVKINVQRYCSSSFIFDRNLYVCLKRVLLDKSNSYLKINPNESCSPISVRTYEQYDHLVSLPLLLPLRTFIWINRNSTYLFDDLFKSKVSSLPSEDLCLLIDRSKPPSYDLVACSTSKLSDYICTQKPIETISTNQSEFKSIQPTPIITNMSCPVGFILFNNLCYYVDTSFVDNIRNGEQICSDKYQNSSLVKFDSHQWGNANTTRFLGRIFDDILLELFYYQLEKKLIIETKTNKHWLRLLVGDKNDENECILRYFTRSTGAFNISRHCNNSGHPVCQSQPIWINETINNSSESIMVEISLPIITNGTADEDLDSNEDIIDDSNSTSIQARKSSSKYRSWLIIIIVSLLTLIILIGTAFLVCYLRQGHGSYSIRSRRKRSNPRTKKSSTTATSNETSNTPSVLYTRLQTSSSIPMDVDMTNSFDNLIINDDHIHLLPPSIHPHNLHESVIVENNEDEESLYATLKSPNDE